MNSVFSLPFFFKFDAKDIQEIIQKITIIENTENFYNR